MDKYAIDLNLIPSTFDFLHVCLAGIVLVLVITLIILSVVLVVALTKAGKKTPEAATSSMIKSEPEPEIKIVQTPPPPIVLKEATPDAALQLLGLLQKEARFLDFIQENVAAYSDAEVGIAARVVHEGCSKVIKQHFTLDTVFHEQEGSKITLEPGFDAMRVRLTGNIVGNAPFTGQLVHKGWQVTQINLPKLTAGHQAKIIAPAEVEL